MQGSYLMLQFALKWQPFSSLRLAALPRVGTHVPIYFKKINLFWKGSATNLLSTCTVINQGQHLSHMAKDSS